MSEHAPVFPRRRGRFETDDQIDGYEVITVDVWAWNDSGDLLTSTLPDGQHAPVLDIDQPIRVSTDVHGQPTILHANLRPTVAYRIARRLGGLGLIDAEQVEHYRAQAPFRAQFSRQRIDVAYLLPFPMVARPSRTQGHFHLYVETAMTWDAAIDLVDALRGLVDAKWADTRTITPGLVVRPHLPADSAGKAVTA